MTTNPSGAGQGPLNFSGTLAADKVEIPTVVFIALLRAVGGSIALDQVELTILPQDWEIQAYDMQDPYRLVIKLEHT